MGGMNTTVNHIGGCPLTETHLESDRVQKDARRAEREGDGRHMTHRKPWLFVLRCGEVFNARLVGLLGLEPRTPAL